MACSLRRAKPAFLDDPESSENSTTYNELAHSKAIINQEKAYSLRLALPAGNLLETFSQLRIPLP